jgi:hypothetical protein
MKSAPNIKLLKSDEGIIQGFCYQIPWKLFSSSFEKLVLMYDELHCKHDTNNRRTELYEKVRSCWPDQWCTIKCLAQKYHTIQRAKKLKNINQQTNPNINTSNNTSIPPCSIPSTLHISTPQQQQQQHDRGDTPLSSPIASPIPPMPATVTPMSTSIHSTIVSPLRRSSPSSLELVSNSTTNININTNTNTNTNFNSQNSKSNDNSSRVQSNSNSNSNSTSTSTSTKNKKTSTPLSTKPSLQSSSSLPSNMNTPSSSSSSGPPLGTIFYDLPVLHERWGTKYFAALQSTTND